VEQTESKLVLVVDDDEVERFLLRRALEDEGYAVDEAETADDALLYCRLAYPDVMVVDNFLPGKTGVELCEALREDPATIRLPIVLLTGSKDPGVRELATRAGASIYLQKTPDPGPVISAIAGLLAPMPNPRTTRH
jgi:two-component system phosphate regulon response regulator PhoB